ncbi:hypothetical protein AB0K40_09855 [Nonomuraea bangladeshensis]|uniref:Uncharacterized protein n=1 Tax=Nonomuraea bangladeshensis TaxID=404385 RepID=A0ABV3GZT3_9ACTN
MTAPGMPLTLGVARAGYLVVALTPAGQAVLGALRGSPVNPSQQLATGFAVTALFLWYLRVTRVLTRHQRARTLQVEATVAMTGLLAVALTAEWLAAAWHALPWLAGHLYVPAALLGLLEVLPVVTRGRYSPPGYTRLVTDKGFLLFALGGFLQPDPAMLTLAGCVVAVSAAHHGKMARTARLPLWHLRDLDAHRFLDGTLVPVTLARLHWLADKVDDKAGKPGGRPDLALVHTVAEQAARLADDVKSPALVELHPHAAHTRTGQAALDWLDHATGLLRAAEERHGDPSPEAARAFGLARAHCAAARADIHSTTGAWERATAAVREAAALWRAQGLADLAAYALAGNALAAVPGGIAVRGLPPAEALRDLVPLLAERGLLPRVRRDVLLAAAACATLTGEAERAGAWRAEAAACRPGRGDDRALNRLRLRAGLSPIHPPHLRARHRMFEELPRTLAERSAPRGLEPLRPLPLPLMMGNGQWPDSQAKRITDRAVLLWAAGRHEQASDELERAAALFEETHRPLDARWIRYVLGFALYWTDPPRAYRNLTSSLDLQERIRDQVAGEDLRIDAGGSTEHLSAVLAWFLIRTGERAGAGPLPLARAFEFVERSRSRVLLELLGHNLPLLAGAELHDLVAAERAADAELARSRALLAGAADPQAALAAVLAARERLNALWDEIAATGRQGAEYAQFRRGDPVTFDDIRRMLAPGGSP